MEIDKKFIINLQGNEFVKFEGLLNEFHKNGGKEIKTEELINSTYERPVFKAIVKGERGDFTGHGDADDSNVNKMIARHKYRMAETRAIARALRLYNNIGMCSAEELGGEDNSQQPPAGQQATGQNSSISLKICPVCKKEHTGKYAKCLDCWKKEQPRDSQARVGETQMICKSCGIEFTSDGKTDICNNCKQF